MQQTDHSETQYSQKICLQHNCTGACIFSWQLEVSGTFTWIEIPKVWIDFRDKEKLIHT